MPRESKPIEPTQGLRELPHSLARVLKAVRTTSHEPSHRTTAAFCDALRTAYNKNPLGNHAVQELPSEQKILQTTEGGKGGGALMFYHLWAYAQYERVPTGVFQIISHLISKFEHEADHGKRQIDGTYEDALRSVAGLYALLKRFQVMFPVDQVTDDHVRELLDAYHRGASDFDAASRSEIVG